MRRSWCVLASCLCAGTMGQSLYTVPSNGVPSSAVSARSSLFDSEAAARERERQQPTYVERIFVEGRDTEAPRKPRAVEQRFADALLAPRPSPTAGLRFLDTTPCMSVVSSWNNLGNSYAPITGCP